MGISTTQMFALIALVFSIAIICGVIDAVLNNVERLNNIVNVGFIYKRRNAL